MLDLIDADTAKGYFGSLEVCLFDDQYKIKTTALNGIEHDLSDFFLKHDRTVFFSTLKKIVDQEEGYKANLNPSADFFNSDAIIFEVTIE